MTTHRLVVEFRWTRRLAFGLSIAAAIPILAVAGLLTALAAQPAAPAGVALSAPSTLAYQGQVKVNGQPFSGQGQFKFAIVSGNGLAAFWSNDGTGLGAAPFQPASAVNLTVTAGLFNVLLGDVTLAHMTQPITSGVFLQPSRALRVWFNDGVNGFQQLAPDVALAAVPYALNAQTLDGLDSSAFLTQHLADARYARISPNAQQIALLKWYTAVSTTQSTFLVNAFPAQIAFDGANVWVTNNGLGGGSTVSVIRTHDGGRVFTPTVGSGPNGLAFDGANMWVANSGDKTVSVLHTTNSGLVFTASVGTNPQDIAFDGTNMWVTNRGDSTVSVLRASDGFHVMTPTVGNGAQGIAFDGTNMWVVNQNDNTVSVLRASDGAHVMTDTAGVEPSFIAFDGANMWVTNFGSGGLGNTVSVLRASDGFHVMTPTTGIGPQGIAFDGANMWVTNFGSSGSGNTVSMLRASDGALLKTVAVGPSPLGIAFDGAYMWVVNDADGSVSKR